MYITYTEYIELGGSASASAFPNLEKKAERLLNYYTQDKIVKAEEVPEVVKELLVEYINMLSNASEGREVSSFSNDGVSVTFDTSTQASTEAQAYDLAVEYLPMDLICCGVDNDEN